MKPRVRIVIGKNFGDEGKGLAVDHFSAAFSGKTLVIRHNGGAQSGHTVELFPLKEGGSGGEKRRRFVFHELSSGSFRQADTFWAETFFPDLYKLSEERKSFQEETGLSPAIFCDDKATPVLIDDVLLNMLLETGRGDARHGSCGMGINEAFLRKQAGFGLSFGEIRKMSSEALAERLLQIREEYGSKRLREITADALGKSADAAFGKNADTDSCKSTDASERIREYLDLLHNPDLLQNEADVMLQNAALVTPVEDAASFVRSYGQILFETGQGLLLDSEYERFAPHLTSSRTGMTNPSRLLSAWDLEPDEICYVTRTYVTRHGAGPLPYECTGGSLGISEEDLTNLENDWQGRIRYATHGSMEEFLKPVSEDLAGMGTGAVTLFLTHLNETEGKILFTWDGQRVGLSVRELAESKGFSGLFSGIYLSDGKDQACTVYESLAGVEKHGED